jgi:hypothetical protein
MMRTKRMMRLGMAAVLACGLMATAPAAMAQGSGGGDGVEARGACSGHADWRLRVRPEDGGKIEVEFEVEHARVGSTWNVRLTDNGTVFFRGVRTANSLGEFEVKRLTNNRSGSDHVVGRAVNQTSGQVCRGSATL